MSTERPFFDPKVELLKAAELLKNAKYIGFDADQILLNSKVPVVNEINRIFETNYREDVIDCWEAVIHLAIRHGMSSEEAEEFNRMIWDSPVVLGASVPCRGAIPLTLKLAASGKDLMVATSRPYTLENETYCSIAEDFPWIKPEKIFIRKKRDRRKGVVFKAHTIKVQKPDVFVDDSIGQAPIILLAAECKLILVNRNEWDENLDPLRVIRIDSLEALVDLV